MHSLIQQQKGFEHQAWYKHCPGFWKEHLLWLLRLIEEATLRDLDRNCELDTKISENAIEEVKTTWLGWEQSTFTCGHERKGFEGWRNHGGERQVRWAVS